MRERCGLVVAWTPVGTHRAFLSPFGLHNLRSPIIRPTPLPSNPNTYKQHSRFNGGFVLYKVSKTRVSVRMSLLQACRQAARVPRVAAVPSLVRYESTKVSSPQGQSVEVTIPPARDVLSADVVSGAPSTSCAFKSKFMSHSVV